MVDHSGIYITALLFCSLCLPESSMDLHVIGQSCSFSGFWSSEYGRQGPMVPIQHDPLVQFRSLLSLLSFSDKTKLPFLPILSFEILNIFIMIRLMSL